MREAVLEHRAAADVEHCFGVPAADPPSRSRGRDDGGDLHG